MLAIITTLKMTLTSITTLGAPAIHFDAAHPVESCKAADKAGVDLVECDDVQTEAQ